MSEENCESCNYTAPSKKAYKDHIESVTHAKNIGKT